MRILRRFDAGLAKVEELVLFAVLIGLVGLASFQVVWRNIMQPLFEKPPLLWMDEVLKHATFGLGLLGATLATHVDKHISLDVVSRMTKGAPKLKVALRVVLRLGTVAVCALLALAGWQQVQVKEQGFEGVLQPWQWQLIIPVAFGLIIVHSLLRLAYDLGTLVTGKVEADPR